MWVKDKLFTFRSTLVALSLPVFLSGCLTGESTESPAVVPETTIQLQGSVGDGPVVSASMQIFSSGGSLLASVESDASANYSVSLSADSQSFPLFIEAQGGTDLVTGLPPDFLMRGAAVLTTGDSRANVNPYSTVAIEIARDMSGGLTSANIASAEAIVTSALNNGLSTLMNSGPLHARIDETNVAEIVRASEALAEIVRRTGVWMDTMGFDGDADSVIRNIGSDLIDNVVDGRGGSRSDARTAAISNVVGAQVLLETMNNELHVNGVDATPAMSSAIDQISSVSVSPGLEDLTISAGMLDQVKLALSVAQAASDSTAVDQVRQVIDSVQPGMQSSFMRSLMPANYRQTIESVVSTVAAADDATIAMLNDVASSGGVIPDDDDPAANRAPVIQGVPAANIAVDADYRFEPTFSDPDGDPLTLSIVNRPGWLSFNSTSGVLSGRPTSGDVGTYSDIRIRVSDGQVTTDLPLFSITVTASNVNSSPSISGSPNPDATVGTQYTFTPGASDADGDTLTFSIQGNPSWASFNSTTGRIRGTPAASDAGNYSNIVVTVSDGQLSASLPAFSITVSEPPPGAPPPPPPPANSAPSISGVPNADATVGTQYTFTPGASDADGDTLTFSIQGKPNWVTFSSTTGRIRGTPSASDVGIHDSIAISVSDGEATASLPAFSITVTQTNSAPTISGSPPANVTVDAAYSFTPNSGDADGDSLTFTASGLPSWLSINSSTGRISGTPRSGDVGDYTGIRITVSDGSASATLGPFSIAVNAVSLGSVTLSWTPPTQNDDGSALNNLAGYKIYWGPSAGNYSNSVTINNAGLSSYVVENLGPGTYVFAAKSFNSAGMESTFSNTATKTVP
jgi:hypothetical protein